MNLPQRRDEHDMKEKQIDANMARGESKADRGTSALFGAIELQLTD
jgi:hypothetical protein